MTVAKSMKLQNHSLNKKHFDNTVLAVKPLANWLNQSEDWF